jgi:hypothetical protein
MNREMRRLLAKQMKPMKDPVKEAQRVERASAMTKVLINQALGTVKAADPKPDTSKKSRKGFGAVFGWILHRLK